MTLHRAQAEEQQHLLQYLAWFIRLRWIAGVAVVVGAAVDHLWLHWYPQRLSIAVLGFVILFYNPILWLVLRDMRENRARRLAGGGGGGGNGGAGGRVSFHVMTWVQLLLDLAILANLTVLTGGIMSPLRPFFVFHMVIASLLLPRLLAFAGAMTGVALLSGCLWATNQWPRTRGEAVTFVAWVVMLMVTIWLASVITQRLHEHRGKLIRRNRRIRKMARVLKRQQRAMVQQEKMAAAGRMAAGVAHEIANPLASMDSLLQLMQRKPEKLKADVVGTLREQVARIAAIVRQMTTFAHPGEGELRVASINDVVTKALDVLRFDTRMKRTKLERQLSPDVPAVQINPDAVEQVVINLTVNALDAMADVPEPKLAVRTACASGSCTIVIEDNGHGIKPEHRKRLFEPFFTTKPVGKGTGLGLSISYSLIKQQRGDIKVESEPGKGTRFTIRLPARLPAASTPAMAGPPSEKAVG
jgi:signal transduction histidine kinase